MAEVEQHSGAPTGARRVRVSWNTVVGAIGRVLIACGLLLFGFVAYQLWGTGLHTARAQDRLEAQFAELIAASPAPVASAPTTSPADAPTATIPGTTIPGTTIPGTTVDGTGTAGTVAPDTTTPAPATPAPATGETLRLGGALARLELPAAGIDHIVVEGVRVPDLRNGPGHFPETPLPGQLGNSAIAGHRTTYGQPFIDIDRATVGDDVVVTTPWGRFVYVVSGASIVPPEAYAEVIPTTDPSRATLTLVSCHPKYSARERFILHATFDPTRSDPLVAEIPLTWEVATASDPEPDSAPADPFATDAATGDDAGAGDAAGAVDSDGPDAAAGADGAGGPPAQGTNSSPGVDDTPVTTVPASVAGVAAVGVAGADVFSDRWFSDPDAFAPVGLWGLLLVLIALAATALSRWRASNWWGLAVGIVPFVVVLYAWFGQVARLLPPNL